MTRKLSSVFVLTLLLVAVLALSASTWAANSKDVTVKQYSFLNTKGVADVDESGPADFVKGSSPVSLGAYDIDGGSPGFILSRTIRDLQAPANPGRFVDWRDPNPQIHFSFTYQVCVGDPDACGRWMHYNMFDPTTGTFPNGINGVALQTNPLASSQGIYTQTDVTETGAGVVTGLVWTPSNDASLQYPITYYDLGAGTFIGSAVDTTIAVSDSGHISYPRIAYQDRGSTQITHLATREADFDANTWEVTYWRKVGSGDVGTWETQVMTDGAAEPFHVSHQIAASPSSDAVAIGWLEEIDTDEDNDYGSQICFRTSSNLGVDWGAKQEILNWDIDTDSWVGWLELGMAYDSDGYLHIVFNANQYDGDGKSAAGRDPSRIMHWTDRVSGSYAGGNLVTVHVADFHGLSMMCGVGGWNTFNVAKPVVSQCNDKLYCIWQQFGNPDVGDSLDCASGEFYDQWNAYNGDIYLAVSSSLNGSLWDAARNLTPANAEDCDTTENNECDHAAHASLSRFGMNTALYTTSWSAVNSGDNHAFQVRDAIAPGFSDDGWYLDCQFVNDLVPDNAPYDQYDGSAGIYTNNPIKWFRLPCVDPVIEPRINVAQGDVIFPDVWVNAGDEYPISVLIENLGNAALTVSNIFDTLASGTPAGIVGITPTSLAIAEGSSDLCDVTLNPGGMVTAGSSASIDAEIFFVSDDPNRDTVSFEIHTIVADTVVEVTWDTISTGLGMALTVGNNGNAGNVGYGEVNLDFLPTGLECDSDQVVYLYDATPIMMVSTSAYSWGPFWQPARAVAGINWWPVAGADESKKGPGDGFEQYQTNTFVSADSTIGGTKIWVAPAENVSFVLERWAVYSYDGASHTAWLGEWIDWDIPSDTGSNNEGGFVAAPGGVDYLYQKGLEYHEDDTSACLDSDRRFGGSGLLGYYLTSEYEADTTVNHTNLHGGFVNLDEDYFADETDSLIPDSVWIWLQKAELSANNGEEADQQILLSYGQKSIAPGDTLIIWTVHASVYDGDETTLQGIIDSSFAWYMAKRSEVGTFGCCGAYTGGYTGNANCDIEGKRNLADISKLIDRVYLSKAALCCEANGNVNGDVEDKINLADISKLIDHVYLSKAETAACP